MAPDPDSLPRPAPSLSDRDHRTATVLVVLGGADPVDEDRLRGSAGKQTLVIAADSGLDVALTAGLTVHHVVGDMDSVDPEALAAAVSAGAEVHRHPADKDATDGELAVDLAVGKLGEAEAVPGGGRGRLLVVGGGGGRLDHLLGDLLGLASDRLARFWVTAHFGSATVSVVRPGQQRAIIGCSGEVVSLLAPLGPARGVTTSGLRWALTDGDLAPGSTRGISNALEQATATVELRQGVLLAVQPGHLARDIENRSTHYDPAPRIGDGGFGGSEVDRP